MTPTKAYKACERLDGWMWRVILRIRGAGVWACISAVAFAYVTIDVPVSLTDCKIAGAANLGSCSKTLVQHDTAMLCLAIALACTVPAFKVLGASLAHKLEARLK